MREAAHAGQIAAYPAQVLSFEATQAVRRPLLCHRRGGWTEEYDEEPIIQESEASEPEATRRDADVTESSRANRGWWDRNADEYQVEHGTFLGDDRFVWGPEGLDEVEAELLGPPEGLKGRDVLEIGAAPPSARAG